MSSETGRAVRGIVSPGSIPFPAWRPPNFDDLPVAAAAISTGVGAVVLIGWWTHTETLKGLVPGLLTMKVNTAIAFVLIGIGLFLRTPTVGPSGRRVGTALIGAAMVLATIVGAQYLLGQDLGIDQWLFQEPVGRIGTVDPNRMSPMTVIAFLAVGAGILAAGYPATRRLAPALLFTAAGISTVNLLDALLHASVPSVLAGATQMALNTGATMLVLGIGAVGLLPEGGPYGVLAGPWASSRLARRLLVAALIAPVLLAWLRMEGEALDLYGSQYGLSLMVLGTFACLAAVIAKSARSARTIEMERAAVLDERDRFFDRSPDLLVTFSEGGRFLRVNPAWSAALGHDLDALLEHSILEYMHPEDVPMAATEFQRQLTGATQILQLRLRFRRHDGAYRWLELTSSPSHDGTRFYAVARDVTERKLEEDRLREPAAAIERRRDRDRARIRTVIETGAFHPVFQPIVDVRESRAVGYEALTRFHDGTRPDESFAIALDCGLGHDLERTTLELAIKAAADLPAGAWVSLNVSPSLLLTETVRELLLPLASRGVVLEITEHESIPAYGPIRDAVRAMGAHVRLAVDDAGAGIANFNHLVELRPDFVKVDAGLVRGMDHDVSRQAVVAGILHFATTAGCEVVAEGIETDRELAKATELGVRLAQGYGLGRPEPVAHWRSRRMDVRTPTAGRG